MSTTQKRSSVGCFRLSISLFFSFLLFCCFLVATLFFVISLVIAVQEIRLPIGEKQTQATIVNVESVTCGKHSIPGYTYTVQFTDQSGHVQTGTLSCEPISTLSRGSPITIVYNPNSPGLIARPDEAGALPIAGVAVAFLFALIDLAMLVCFILWVRHEKNILGPLLPGRKRAHSRQDREAGQVIFASPTAGSYVKNENWTPEQEQPEASQLALFETQDTQEEKPFEQ